jgi:hypothetical protein
MATIDEYRGERIARLRNEPKSPLRRALSPLIVSRFLQQVRGCVFDQSRHVQFFFAVQT